MDILQTAIELRNRGIAGNEGATGTVGPQGPQGEPGAKGDTGDTGPAGADGIDGVDGTNGVGVPTGGTTGQALVKNSDTDYDTEWATITGGGGYVGDFDGGAADTVYGGIDPIDGGNA